MQRVALLNGENINQDYDLAKIFKSLASSGVVEGLEVQSGKVTAGYGFIDVTRDGETFPVLFQNTADLVIDTTGTKKVFIELNQANIDDGINNNSNGTGIGEIKTASNYPSNNFIKLASIDSGVITDERDQVLLKFESFNGDLFKLLAVGEGLAEIRKQNGDLGSLNIADILLNGAGVGTANGLVKTDSQNRIIGNGELLTGVKSKTEEILIRGAIPGERIVGLTDPASYSEGNPTYTNEYQLKSGSIGQTFITPDRVNQTISQVKLNFGSYYNAHLKTFALYIYDSVAKNAILWSNTGFNGNTINNGVKIWDITSANLEPNTEYYIELAVTNVYSTSYYARVRYQTGDNYGAGKMYIDGAESVGNDMYFTIDSTGQLEVPGGAIVPFRQGYKELEDVTKVYRFLSGDQSQIIGFFKGVTDGYTDNREIYGGNSLEIYGDNIFGGAFQHTQNSIRYIELDASYIGTGTANIRVYSLDAGGNLDIAGGSLVDLDFSFSSISKIDLGSDIGITPNQRYGFIISNSAGDTNNKLVLNGLEKPVISETTQYSNTSQDDWIKYKDIAIDGYGVRSYFISVGLWTNNASYIARVEIRQNGVTLWASSTYSTSEVTLTGTITNVDSTNGPLELWTWGDYNVYAKNLNIDLPGLAFDLFKSTTGINGVSKQEGGVYSFTLSTVPITTIDIVNTGNLDVGQDIQNNINYYVTPGGNLSTSDSGNTYLGVKAVGQKILLGVLSKKADSINFSRGGTSASGIVKYNHNLGRKPEFIKFDGVDSRDSNYFAYSSGSWSEIGGNKAIYKQYDNPGSYTTGYSILNRCYTGGSDYQYGKVIEVTDTDISIEWVYGGGTTSQTTFYVTALLY